MTTLIILPTQLYARTPREWAQYDKVWLVEDPYYINKRMHPLKLWLHRASMLAYFDDIPVKSKKYISESFTLPVSFTIAHPTDKCMVDKYKRGNFIDPPNFILQISKLEIFDTPVHHAFYKRVRTAYDILMTKDKPIGGKWSFDSENRKRFEFSFKETNMLEKGYESKFISKAKSITSMSDIPLKLNHLPYPTTRKDALSLLRRFIQVKLEGFGPYEDALREDVVVGYHSCLSSSLNIGLLTPWDIINAVSSSKAPLASIEGFIRQLMWREFIRMRYILHGMISWDFLHRMNIPIDRSWYAGTTGIKTLDWSISRVLRYGYAHHIDRLMLLSNYAVLLRLDYDSIKKWFITMFIDGYEWAMLNVCMNVNSLSTPRYMTRCYVNNGNYLKKMGLSISKEDLLHLNELYRQFLIDNKDLCKKDYRLAAQVKRLVKK